MNKNYSKIVLGAVAIILIVVMIVAGGATPQEPSCKDEPVFSGGMEVEKKPVIYFYPTTETPVTVTMGYPENIICSYPKYDNGWNVIAHPDGTLTDIKTNRELYALYYEANLDLGVKLSRTGFVVERENLISFLEEKLAVLGLTDREANEFIIYWLPILEQNEYNYIYFATNKELNEKVPLNINPKPDTLIRICMYYVGLEAPMKFVEQTLEPIDRTGFTVVEWGGAELEGVIPFKVKLPRNDIRIPPYRIPKLGGK